MSSIPFWLRCTRCGWRRALVPTAPATPENRTADWQDARRRARRTTCPACGDVNVAAIELDTFGNVVREAA